jgi:hypothetical protein
MTTAKQNVSNRLEAELQLSEGHGSLSNEVASDFKS